MTKTPWHLWVVGVVSLLWHAIGVFDFSMSAMRNESYIAQLTPEQLAFFTSFPLWAMITWAIAVIAALVGSVLLLMRRAMALFAFVAGLLAMALTSVHNYILADVNMVQISGPISMVFTMLIIVVAVMLVVYALRQKTNGVLT